MISRRLFAGETQGAVRQATARATRGLTAYDSDGQLLTGSYMDYAMPRAEDSPEVRFESHPVPAKNNPLGVKGCGEAGSTGPLTSGMNASVVAPSDYGAHNTQMLAPPQPVW